MGDVSRPGRTEQSLSQAERGLTFAAHTVQLVSTLNILESAQAGERRVRAAWGQARRHHLLRFGPDAVHHACCCITVILNCQSSSVPPPAPPYHVLTSVERQREGCPAHEQTGAVFGSPCTHTHYRLHSTSLHLYSSYILWVRPHWLEVHASLAGW